MITTEQRRALDAADADYVREMDAATAAHPGSLWTPALGEKYRPIARKYFSARARIQGRTEADNASDFRQMGRETTTMRRTATQAKPCRLTIMVPWFAERLGSPGCHLENGGIAPRGPVKLSMDGQVLASATAGTLRYAYLPGGFQVTATLAACDLDDLRSRAASVEFVGTWNDLDILGLSEIKLGSERPTFRGVTIKMTEGAT